LFSDAIRACVEGDFNGIAVFAVSENVIPSVFVLNAVRLTCCLPAEGAGKLQL
jgi:hypothetical protein